VLANHVFEGLYALDEAYRPIPMLADGMPNVSKDGLTYTIKLRKGVKFHNGKEMTSDDVVASLVRWSKRSVYGKSLFAQVVDFKAVDKSTVELKLKEKSAIVLVSLAVPNNMGAIYPKEIADKFPPDQRATEWVGTGPFKIVEWKPDQYIRMTRFDDYKALGASRAATAERRSRTLTSCAGSRCRTPRAAPRRSSPATSTWRTTSWRMRTIA
jgi:peptide/nickel transport system substrate-binding protein